MQGAVNMVTGRGGKGQAGGEARATRGRSGGGFGERASSSVGDCPSRIAGDKGTESSIDIDASSSKHSNGIVVACSSLAAMTVLFRARRAFPRTLVPGAPTVPVGEGVGAGAAEDSGATWATPATRGLESEQISGS